MRYAQIEKECLASVWGCEKFQRYLVGLESFILQTDHKPLVPLINDRDLDRVPLRCQRLLLRLMRFSPKAQYVPGSTLQVADTLSRHPLNKPARRDELLVGEIETHVANNTKVLPCSENRLAQIRDATREDVLVSDAMWYTVHGWPRYSDDVPVEYRQFYSVHDYLSVADGLLLYNSQIVIPKALQHDILEKIHAGHLGINKCRERASDSVWWFGMSKDIQNRVNACNHCQTQRPTQRKQPLITSDLPGTPWERIAADLLLYKGQNFLAVIDYYSRFIELVHLSSTSASLVVKKLKNLFARWGILVGSLCRTMVHNSARESSHSLLRSMTSHM